MNWTLAPSLEQLRDQVNAMFPGRDKTSDGSIGDQSHAARKSDHNPNQYGVVTAIDIDADLSETENVGVLVAALQASHDPRIKYIIFNRRITVKGDVTRWKNYTGANAHQHHAHISVSSDPKLYNDARPWRLDIASAIESQQGTIPIGERTLVRGMKGDDVRELQKRLNVTPADGIFGAGTEAAIKAFQSEHKLQADGKVGPKTRAALGV